MQAGLSYSQPANATATAGMSRWLLGTRSYSRAIACDCVGCNLACFRRPLTGQMDGNVAGGDGEDVDLSKTSDQDSDWSASKVLHTADSKRVNLDL